MPCARSGFPQLRLALFLHCSSSLLRKCRQNAWKIERMNPTEKNVHYTSKGPHINRLVCLAVQDHFRRTICRLSKNKKYTVPEGLSSKTGTKEMNEVPKSTNLISAVSSLDERRMFSLRSTHFVIRLYVVMTDPQRMEMCKRTAHTSK